MTTPGQLDLPIRGISTQFAYIPYTKSSKNVFYQQVGRISIVSKAILQWYGQSKSNKPLTDPSLQRVQSNSHVYSKLNRKEQRNIWTQHPENSLLHQSPTHVDIEQLTVENDKNRIVRQRKLIRLLGLDEVVHHNNAILQQSCAQSSTIDTLEQLHDSQEDNVHKDDPQGINQGTLSYLNIGLQQEHQLEMAEKVSTSKVLPLMHGNSNEQHACGGKVISNAEYVHKRARQTSQQADQNVVQPSTKKAASGDAYNRKLRERYKQKWQKIELYSARSVADLTRVEQQHVPEEQSYALAFIDTCDNPFQAVSVSVNTDSTHQSVNPASQHVPQDVNQGVHNLYTSLADVHDSNRSKGRECDATYQYRSFNAEKIGDQNGFTYYNMALPHALNAQPRVQLVNPWIHRGLTQGDLGSSRLIALLKAMLPGLKLAKIKRPRDCAHPTSHARASHVDTQAYGNTLSLSQSAQKLFKLVHHAGPGAADGVVTRPSTPAGADHVADVIKNMHVYACGAGEQFCLQIDDLQELRSVVVPALWGMQRSLPLQRLDLMRLAISLELAASMQSSKVSSSAKSHQQPTNNDSTFDTTCIDSLTCLLLFDPTQGQSEASSEAVQKLYCHCLAMVTSLLAPHLSQPASGGSQSNGAAGAGQVTNDWAERVEDAAEIVEVFFGVIEVVSREGVQELQWGVKDVEGVMGEVKVTDGYVAGLFDSVGQVELGVGGVGSRRKGTESCLAEGQSSQVRMVGNVAYKLTHLFQVNLEESEASLVLVILFTVFFLFCAL